MTQLSSAGQNKLLSPKAHAVAILLNARRCIMYSGEAQSVLKMRTLDNAVDMVMTGMVHGEPGIAASMRPKEVQLPLYDLEEGR
jgi:hypothetical protein